MPLFYTITLIDLANIQIWKILKKHLWIAMTTHICFPSRDKWLSPNCRTGTCQREGFTYFTYLVRLRPPSFADLTENPSLATLFVHEPADTKIRYHTKPRYWNGTYIGIENSWFWYYTSIIFCQKIPQWVIGLTLRLAWGIFYWD